MGKGSLVTSIVTADDKQATEFVTQAAHMNGRMLVLNSRCAKESTGHGSPLPLLTHGGPGRAGGGEEMGGKRGVMHYLQRTSIQGHPQTITAITKQFQVGADQPEAQPHVFRKHFEELEIGQTVFTHKHTVTTTDIVNFANVSGDNFYAQFFVSRGSVDQDATVQKFEFLSGEGRWEEMVGQKCLGAYTPLVDSKFMWQGKCDITNKTLERVKNYKKPE